MSLGPWATYQGQPGQAYMAGQQANNIAAGTPNAAIPVPSNPYQNLAQTQAAAAAANKNLAAGGTGASPNFLDAISKMIGGGQGQQGGFNWQQMLAQGGPRLANGQPLGQGGAPSAAPLPQGQMPLSQGLLSNLAAARQPLMNTTPPNAANNFNGAGLQNYLMMMRAMG